MARIAWDPILGRAVEIVDAHDTPMSLRQVFYRLVSDELIPNTLTTYTRLARLSARWRREGRFPELVDQGRSIDRPVSFTDPDDAQRWLRQVYRRDRTSGQPWSVYVGGEKATLSVQLGAWFGDRGVPVLTLRGFCGQALVGQVRDDILMASRPAVLLYAGDHDPSGEEILANFVGRVGAFDKVVRVAVTPEQVDHFGLPPLPGKATDPRAKGFVAKHGRLVQVEVEALDPDDLRDLYDDAVADYWDGDAYRAVLDLEAEDREAL